MADYEHITPDRFLRKYDGRELDDVLVIDVREPFEWEYWHLDRTELIPLRDLPSALDSLPRDRTIYVLCAHGVRSEAACRYLTANGLRGVVNVLGGASALAAARGFAYD